MKAALSAAEWAAHPSLSSHLIRQKITGWAAGKPGEEPLYFPTKNGIAAVNLHEQEFGFTREDVDNIRWAGDIHGPWVKELRDLADRIEALLPREEE